MTRTNLALFVTFFFSCLVFADYEIIKEGNQITIKNGKNTLKIVQESSDKNEAYLKTIGSLIENIELIKTNAENSAKLLRSMGMEEEAKNEEISDQETIKKLESTIEMLVGWLQ